MKRIALAVAASIATTIPTAAFAQSHFDKLQLLPYDIFGGCALGALAGWWLGRRSTPTLGAILGGIVGAVIGGAFGP